MSAPRPILLHGSGGDPGAWAQQLARFEGAVAPALPGHPDGAPLRAVGDLAAAVTPAVAGVPGPRVLVGHSLGGAVALELALAAPALVDGLVLVATGARLPVPDHAAARLRDDFPGECRRLVAGFFADGDAPAARRALRTLLGLGPATLEADYAACRTVDLRGRLSGVRVPALVVAGGEDPLIPPRFAETLARELPLATMAVVAGARHMPMAEDGGPVSLLLAGFLARLEITLAGL